MEPFSLPTPSSPDPLLPSSASEWDPLALFDPSFSRLSPVSSLISVAVDEIRRHKVSGSVSEGDGREPRCCPSISIEMLCFAQNTFDSSFIPHPSSPPSPQPSSLFHPILHDKKGKRTEEREKGREENQQFVVLNDCTMDRGPSERMCCFDTFCNGSKITTVTGDGYFSLPFPSFSCFMLGNQKTGRFS